MLAEIFQKPKPILGPVCLAALPGSSVWSGNRDRLIARAEQEAAALATGGVDGIIVENRQDALFSPANRKHQEYYGPEECLDRVDPAAAIAMALLVWRLRQLTGLPVGISLAQNDPETALAIAMNTDAAFIRLAVPVGARLTESGVINSRFHALLHYRNRLKTDLPLILADVSLSHIVPPVGASFQAPYQVFHPRTTSVPTSDTEEGGREGNAARLVHLIQVARALPATGNIIPVLSDTDLSPADVPAFREAAGLTALIECHERADALEDYFTQGDGLLLSGFIRKSRALEPDTSPTIDMTRVEEIVNRLRGVKSVLEMDPDVFLQR
jgi:predicted TIM-barrel enzyme